MSKKKNFILIILIAAIAIIFTFVVLYLYFRQFSIELSVEQNDWGGFGSYVGGTLGTFFAFASFGILLYTFNSQQRQAKNNEIQKFETTFYSLLELHNQSLRELEAKLDKHKLTRLFNSDLTATYIDIELEKGGAWEIDGISDPEKLKKTKLKRHRQRLKRLQYDILEEVELSQYFRILYQLLKFVAKYNVNNIDYKFDDKHLDNRGNISLEHEKMYTSLIRGFVPVKFLPVLALNCIPTDDGLHNLTKYRKLLERYDFLEHMQLNPLPNNLSTFFILDRYSNALGKNGDINTKVESIRSEYLLLLELDLMKDGYLLK